MIRIPAYRRYLIGAVFLGSAACGLAQSPTPNTTLVVPPPGRAYVDSEVSWYRAEAFVEGDGSRQRFPGDLDFILAVLRASYSPVRHVAVGVDLPYRWANYHEPGLEATFTSRGLPGVGAFVDWSPSGPATRVEATVRVEYFVARSEGDRVVNVSDGINRLAATFQLQSRSASEPAQWIWAGNVHAQYGPSAAVDGDYFEWRVQVEGGTRVASPASRTLYAVGLIGYRGSSSARQEGNLFQDRGSKDIFGGILLDWRLLRAAQTPGQSLILSVVRDAWTRNALAGWRTTLSFRSAL